MPNEPCGDSVCIDKEDLTSLRSTIAATERERDEAVAAVAGMRGLFEIDPFEEGGLILDALRIAGDAVRAHSGYDPGAEYDKVAEKVKAVLSSPSLGASTLEYIKGLEADNEKAKGLLRRSREIDCLPKCDDLNINTQMCDMRGEQCQWCALNAAIDAYLKGGEW